MKSRSKYNPKAKKDSKLEIQDPRVAVYRDYMQKHTIICKFMGIWPIEKALNWWIQAKWKPKGEIKLQLGSMGFFIEIFDLIEDRYIIFG